MEFIYLLTLRIDFSLPLAALASGMLLKQVVEVVDLSTPLSLERVDSSEICLSCFQLIILSGKRNVLISLAVERSLRVRRAQKLFKLSLTPIISPATDAPPY